LNSAIFLPFLSSFLPHRARRNGVAVQPPPPAGNLRRIAKGPLAGREEILQYAEREQIASRVAAVIEQLFRGDVSTGTDRHVKSFCQQVRKFVMTRIRTASPDSRTMTLLGLMSNG
jgi:hypothetical protein